MEQIKSTEGIIEDIMSQVFQGDGFLYTSVVSKTGLMISGKAQFKTVRNAEDYSSLVAVMFSAAESCGRVEHEGAMLDYLRAHYGDRDIYVTKVGSSLMIVVMVDGSMEPETVLDSMQRFMVRTREDLTWLQ